MEGRLRREKGGGRGRGRTGDGGEGVAVLDRVERAQPEGRAGLQQLGARQEAAAAAGDAAQVGVQQRGVGVP